MNDNHPPDYIANPATDPAITPGREPLFNIPFLTGTIALVLLAIFLFTNFFPEASTPFVLHSVFVPAEFHWQNAYTLFSYALLHFGWPHIMMNGFGLLAFGSAVERLGGKRFYLLIFLGGILLGALGHWVLFRHSMTALGGASAGVSALFGAALPFIIPRNQIMGTCIVFVLTNLVFGLMGMPGSEPLHDPISIAWQAHIIGFVFGLVTCLSTQPKK